MKTTFYKKIAAIVLAGCMLSSCTKKFEETNTDPNRISQISPGTLLNPILYSVAGFNMEKCDDITFNLMQVALPFPSASGGVHRYDISENAGASTWNTYYKWLNNVKEMMIAAENAADENYQAIAMTLNAWIYSNLTDCFGDVPMTEAVKGDEGIWRPAFDSQEAVYTKLLADLKTANTLFNTSKAMVYGTEILYGNNIAAWKKFCNSLHLRLLLRVSNKSAFNSMEKIRNMVDQPATYPVFTSNADAAILELTGITPLVSPWGRAVDFTTYRAAGKFFLDNLNDFNDPRRPLFASQAKDATGATNIGYKGIPSGYAGNDSQFDYIPSNVNRQLVTAPMICVIMSYAEVEMIKAELEHYYNNEVAAKAAYEKGVKAAIEQWGATMPADYFSNPSAAYDGTLERIMLQKYYALFFNDYQAWFEYRRTGLPVLPTADGMLNNKVMPSRFMYPISIRSSNTDNYQKAVQEMGGDNINVKVWWDE